MASWALPEAITQSYVNVDGLNVHILGAGSPADPLILLLHGFPELSYSWRKTILPLAAAGYHVVAPDMRGYGRTCTQPVAYDDNLAPFRPIAIVRDIVALVAALRVSTVHAIVGHDMGSLVAGNCALLRPDLFKRVVCISVPFTGAPRYTVPPDHHNTPRGIIRPPPLLPLISRALGALDPPRKHYTVYFSSPSADADMRNAPGGLHGFMRAYYHVKSADGPANEAHELDVEKPIEAIAAALPEYYVMRAERDMPGSVLPHAPSLAAVAENRWLPEDELAVYVDEYARTGFQGGLNGYRCATDPSGAWSADLLAFSGKTVEVPAMFLAGKKDWGTWQFPGAVKLMESEFAKMEGRFILVDGAGHWVQQEQAEAVVKHLLGFFKET
ncbi:alpha/beta hydrolase fold protein [Vararia minispora EC-137]|uniref:Alpha/beta hydrolase fold protein n=1 Tax=Vararia minispora EC-137 TaxID=1314806 RepID=A0ACB8QVJ5_9AGAM|nr:alpha/beta hydrolase fold protein [Vararia minispora EC-137]